MPLFQYRALQVDGSMTEGNLEAGGRQEAYRMLEGRGLNPIGLDEKSERSPSGETRFHLRLGGRKVPHRALENFTRQMSSLLAAGVPLARTLRLLSREASNPAAKKKWQAVHDMVIDGTSLAGAMGRFPKTFPRVYVAMVQAGETGGFLDLVLAQIADFQSREKDLRSKMTSALIYPMVLGFLCVSVVTFLMIFFIPKFQSIFAGFDATLPVLTQFIVASSEWMRDYGVLIALALAAVVFMMNRWLQTDRGKRAWEHLALKIPVVGSLIARFAMTRFCRMLGTLIGAGVPLIAALRVARESIGNQILIDAVNDSITRVQQGDRLATSLSDCKELFPGSVLEMIAVSEETGRLDKELVRMAGDLDGDLDRQLKTAVSLAEPALLIVMALVIGLIVVGMVLPIFTIQDYIK